jgi:hypothetical protein
MMHATLHLSQWWIRLMSEMRRHWTLASSVSSKALVVTLAFDEPTYIDRKFRK